MINVQATAGRRIPEIAKRWRAGAFCLATGRTFWLTAGGQFTAEEPHWAIVARFDSSDWMIVKRAQLPAGSVLIYADFESLR